MSDQSGDGRILPAVEDSATDTDPATVGPYDADTNGRCAAGHPVNQFGRCEPLNDGTGE